MRRFIRAMAGSAVLAAGLALAANPAAAQSGKPVTFWYEAANPSQQKALNEALVQPYNAAHPDGPLQLSYRGATLDKQLRVALLSGTGPDVVYTPGPGYVAAMAQAGQLLPLDDYAAKEGWRDRIQPQFLALGSYGGKLYALPKTFESMHLFYDKVMFKENGWTPPKNLAELEKLAEAMKAEGLTPFGAGNADWRGSNEWYVSIVLNNYAGPETVAKALRGEIPWTSPEFAGAIDLLKSWYQKGYFGQNYFSLTDEQAFATIASGQAGMSPNGTWAFGWANSYFDGKSHDLGVAPFPTLRDGVPYPIYPLGIGSTLSINKNARNPDGAAEVLNAVFDPGFYDRISKGWPGDWNIPLKDTGSVDLAKNTSPAFAEAVASVKDAVGRNQFGYTTWTFWPPATEQYLINGIEEVWLDRTTTADYLAKLDATFKQEKAEGKVPPIPAAN